MNFLCFSKTKDSISNFSKMYKDQSSMYFVFIILVIKVETLQTWLKGRKIKQENSSKRQSIWRILVSQSINNKEFANHVDISLHFYIS